MTFPASDPIAVGVPTSTEPRAAEVPGPTGPAAQHWIEICVLPWAIWTAIGLAVLRWPLLQARDAARRISTGNDAHLDS